MNSGLMESRDQAPNSWWCTSSFFPLKCSLWGWHSVGLRTWVAIGFVRCPPVPIPPCKLFIPPAPFCERGLQLSVGLFSHIQGSKIPLGAIHHGCTWERRDSHSESGASLIWRDERQSPGEEVKRQLLWAVPGPSPPSESPTTLSQDEKNTDVTPGMQNCSVYPKSN